MTLKYKTTLVGLKGVEKERGRETMPETLRMGKLNKLIKIYTDTHTPK